MLQPVRMRQFVQMARLYVAAERDACRRHRPGNFGAALRWADHRSTRIPMAALAGGVSAFGGGTWTNPAGNVAVTLVHVTPRHRGRDVRMALALYVALGAGGSVALLVLGTVVPAIGLGWQDTVALLAVMMTVGTVVGLTMPWLDADRRVHRRALARRTETDRDLTVVLVSGLVSRGSAHDVLSTARTIGREADQRGWTLVATATDPQIARRYRRLFGFADVEAAPSSSKHHLIRSPQLRELRSP